jgi:hypothetical protein
MAAIVRTLVIDEHLIILFSFGVCKFIHFFLQFNLAVGKTYFSVNILIKPVFKNVFSNPVFFLSLVGTSPAAVHFRESVFFEIFTVCAD